MPGIGSADETQFHVDGHTKARLLGQTFPDNSLFNQLTGSSAKDFESDLRLNFEADNGPWSAQAAYQLFVMYGDRIEYSRGILPSVGLAFDRLPSDRLRLFDLTSVLRDEGKFAAVHRLDRLSFGYTGEKTVLRVGRQAISWGNGFFFAPMDIVNPFDPAAIDTEYKTGDDMIYAQYLKDSGDDIQGAVVFRRDPLTGDVDSDQGTVAVKYHGISGNSEFDLLLARNYGDPTLGVGGNRSIGGAVWRADVVITDADTETRAQLVTNLSYSWTWGGKNISGVLEYYYNGFGQDAGDYDNLSGNLQLLKMLARGQVFSLGRHYLAGGITVEVTPLWTLTPNMFANLQDPSALLQLVTQHNLGDNLTFLGAINVPLGSDGSEYGGIPTQEPDQYLSFDFGVFAQIAWYF